MSGTWLVSRPAPIGTVDEVYPNEQAATERETALRLGGCQRVVAWFCAESVGPWQAAMVPQAARNGAVSDLRAVPEHPDDRYGFEDWTRRLIEAANEGMSA